MISTVMTCIMTSTLFTNDITELLWITLYRGKNDPFLSASPYIRIYVHNSLNYINVRVLAIPFICVIFDRIASSVRCSWF